MQGRSPVGQLPGDSYQTLYAATAAGLGYAVNATTGALRWTTDGDSSLAGNQPLGAALVAAPVVSPTRNLAFFATRNLTGAQNRLFAFDAKTGACRWVFNGACSGTTSTQNLGQINGAVLHDATAKKLFIAATQLSGGSTLWAVDAGDTTPGTLLWSANRGPSDVSPAFVDATRTSLYFATGAGTSAGRVFRLQTSNGASVWTSSGLDQVYCVATNTRRRTTQCAAGSAISSGPVAIWSGALANRVLFGTADGHLRMIDNNAAHVWQTLSPIAGASAPLVLTADNRVYVGSSDGRLYELNLTTGAVINSRVVGDGASAVGSPSYDVYATKLYVGTSAGTIYRFNSPL